MATMLMFDDVTVSLLPGGYDAYAGYVDGLYDNISAIQARFPTAHILSIDVNGSNTSADCLDIEAGDATNATAVSWVQEKAARGDKLIVVYTSVSNVTALVSALTQAGVARSRYKVWSAHYGAGEHICGPSTCKLTGVACDGTQWTDTAEGRSLDESELESDFFNGVSPGGSYPTIEEGSTGAAVKTAQTRLNVWGASPKLTVDGDFGPATLAAVKAFQSKEKLTVDGIVGPQTWAALMKSPGAAPQPKGPYRHVVPKGNTLSFLGLANLRGMTEDEFLWEQQKFHTEGKLNDEHLLYLQQMKDAGDTAAKCGWARPPLAAGTVYWTSNP